ncbi:hypothetical protein AKJ51_04285 [candidate division MSBL1 archaeon SCGC-AAA382A20]|uniref:DUF2119 domain-containing protein n=1 Tax=candidate division MSBL1 archaeon SCGC-AAA382A20 TaxID=1698280 RepID=A0A133VI04_9EURY|nr:hypothetical protein AKJ51_04285 [candidate division MSBL1 archaeon SCGC-AAA382A20]
MMQDWIGGGRPFRLFVSGLHGKEHEVTDPILWEFSERVSKKNLKGSLVLHSLGREDREYVSTLDNEYWNTKTGKELLQIVEKYQPTIYLELHSYSDPSKLTNPDRIDKKGVPPLIELETGILAGSVSPRLRRDKFRKEDFCFLLEIPRDKGHCEEIYEILKIIGQGMDREDIVEDLKEKFPTQMKKSKKYYELFYEENLSVPAY